MKIGSLFSGAGGLDMAAEQVFDARTVWHCELDPAASKVLAHRWPDVPNLGDITAVDWSTVEPIDVLCGGFPCQDVSAAGRRGGIAPGTRSGLWLEFANTIDRLRPPTVVIENVRGLLSGYAHRAVESVRLGMGDRPARPVLRAAGAVLGDLADLGYNAQWVTVSAASVGAPHKRERVFILATAANADNAAADGQWTREEPREGGSDVADAARHGWPRINDSARRAPACGGRVRIAAGSTGSTSTPVDLLPTPRSLDSTGVRGRTPNRSDEANARAGLTLTDAVQLLPTPSVADGDGGHATRSGARSGELLLPGVARAFGNGDLLPTPNASDGSGGGSHPDNRKGHSQQIADYVLLHGTSRWGKYEPAIRRWESLTRPAPSPTEPTARGNLRLAAGFSEWMIGWLDGWVTAVPDISRNDQLRIIGNGVCPQQATAALYELLRIAETTLATTGVR